MRLIFIFIILICSTSIAKEKESVVANQIFHGCKYFFENTFNTRENIARKAMCSGYFFGVGSSLLMLKNNTKFKTCIPDTLSTEQVVKIFLDWSKKNPAKMQDFATKSVIESVAAYFKCGSD